MDGQTNAASQRLHHTAEFADEAVNLSRRTAAGARTFAYRKEYAETVPWNAFVYAMYEPLLDAAKRQGGSANPAKPARIGQWTSIAQHHRIAAGENVPDLDRSFRFG